MDKERLNSMNKERSIAWAIRVEGRYRGAGEGGGRYQGEGEWRVIVEKKKQLICRLDGTLQQG